MWEDVTAHPLQQTARGKRRGCREKESERLDRILRQGLEKTWTALEECRWAKTNMDWATWEAVV